MECKRHLADEKRALEVAERKQKALQKKQEQVAAEAKVWRDKFNTEKAAADAAAAAEARIDRATLYAIVCRVLLILTVLRMRCLSHRLLKRRG